MQIKPVLLFPFFPFSQFFSIFPPFPLFSYFFPFFSSFFSPKMVFIPPPGKGNVIYIYPCVCMYILLYLYLVNANQTLPRNPKFYFLVLLYSFQCLEVFVILSRLLQGHLYIIHSTYLPQSPPFRNHFLSL